MSTSEDINNIEDESVILYYKNDDFYNIEWLNKEIEKARENIKKHQISTAIIEKIFFYPREKDGYNYHLAGIIISDFNWEYYSPGTIKDFYIRNVEAEYCLRNNSKIYKYYTDTYDIGTTLDLIE